MQNRSYERYVELLRAAELQTYERTSARFAATLGSTAASSWLARNPLSAFTSALGIVSVATFLLMQANVFSTTEGSASKSATTVLLRGESTVAESIAEDPKNADHSMPDVMTNIKGERRVSVTRPTNIERSVDLDLSVDGDHFMTEQGIDQSSETLRDIPLAALIESSSQNMSIMMDPLLPLSAPYIELGEPSRREMSLALSMRSLPMLDPTFNVNARAVAMMDVGAGIELGLGVGVQQQRQARSKFIGFRDTTFEVGGQGYSSKIGQYGTQEESLSYFEIGLAARYQFDRLLNSEKVAPAVSAFAGIEGSKFVTEQTLTFDWSVAPSITTFGGLSLREYLWSERSMTASPVLGVRMQF
jgi:hypothetical protein